MAGMATATEEEKAKGMAAWMAWKAQHDSHILDFGAPLMGGQRLEAGGKWANSANEVSGYSLVQAESAEQLRGMLENHPHLAWAPGCAIEIHEAVPM